MEDVIIKIKGMMCGHCEKTVHEAALSVKGVTKASADFKKGEVKVSFDTSLTDLETIKKPLWNQVMRLWMKGRPARYRSENRRRK